VIDLSGKTILVTGASRGIGAVTAQTLARCGARVVAHYGRSRTEVESIAESIWLDGRGSCVLVQADLSVPGAGFRLWQDALEITDEVHVLVNNAGIIRVVGLDHPEPEWHDAWWDTLQVNLMAVADLCRAAIPAMTAHGGGVIINLASRGGQRGTTLESMHYAASKAGVMALTKTIARQCARHGILAYTIAPGYVQSEMADQTIDVYGLEPIVRDIPMGSIAPPEDVANTIAFLAAGLAPHMTGATLDINGASYVR
jgi:NAD(P)-dependent dehydrogenase (short-subunit alcohol dehydrogenase family)